MIVFVSDILIKLIIRIWDLVLNTAQLLLALLIKKILNFNHSFHPFENPDIFAFCQVFFSNLKVLVFQLIIQDRET